MYHPINPDHTAPTSPKDGSVQSAVRPDGSYEIIFGNENRNTDYTVSGYNAYGFSANGSARKPEEPQPQEPKRKKSRKRTSLPTVMLTVSIILTVVSIALSVMTFVMVHHSDPRLTIGTKPHSTETVKPTENQTVTVPTDAYAVATAKTVDSVVDITTAGGSGSGVIWASGSEYSYIVTCHHVVSGEEEIKITLRSGEDCYAELVGNDARTDIAVLRIQKTDLSPILLPNEETCMMLGQAVIAIGNPLGTLGNSVSDGILSSLTRTVSIEGTTMELLQTTAAVNHGNSGGGLFDLNGQLIGLVNAKISETSVEGIGFAIPIDTLKPIVGELIRQGYVSGRPALGFSTAMIDSKESFYAAIERYPDLESIATFR
ncbi:MAG: trypsin-like peptidase domain-containing protein [Clostridia bacterium]|nr:trypsin-like peptidase domain-containing protein [Clostridia bacterium]